MERETKHLAYRNEKTYDFAKRKGTNFCFSSLIKRNKHIILSIERDQTYAFAKICRPALWLLKLSRGYFWGIKEKASKVDGRDRLCQQCTVSDKTPDSKKIQKQKLFWLKKTW